MSQDDFLGDTMATRLQRRQQTVALLTIGFVPPLAAAVAATLGAQWGPQMLLVGCSLSAFAGGLLAFRYAGRGQSALAGHLLVASALLLTWGMAWAAMFANLHLGHAALPGPLQVLANVLHDSLLFLTLVVLLTAALVGHPAMVLAAGVANFALALMMRWVDPDAFHVAYLFNNIAFTVMLMPAGLTVRHDREQVTANERRLKRALADQRAALHAAPAAIWAFDENGIVRVMNPLARTWFKQRTGVAPEVGTRPPRNELPGGTRLIDLHRDALQGKARRIAFTEQSTDGPRFLELATRPIEDAGRFLGTAFLLADVTEREAKAELERAQREHEARLSHLEDMARFKTRLLNTASHELNTPLTPMRLQVHVLKRDPEKRLNERQQRAVRMVDRNLDRLEGIVSEILDVSRLESGTVRLEKHLVDLAALVQDEVEGYYPLAAARNIQLRLEMDDHVWVHADERRIGQVLANLLGNAVKFAHRHIHVTCRIKGGRAHVQVQDDGAGWAQSDQERLFKPFGQLHADDPTREGTGLGLYICKGLISMHDGRIGGTSPGPGKGAIFGFHLPLQAPPGGGP